MSILARAALAGSAVGLAFASWLPVAGAVALTVTPSSIAAGGSVNVTGNCEPNSSGTAMSPAFLHDATHDFAGVGAVTFTTDAAGNFSAAAQIPATRSPGSYKVTARCGGGNLGLEAPLVVTRGSLPFTGRPLFRLISIGLGILAAGCLLFFVGSRTRHRTASNPRHAGKSRV